MLALLSDADVRVVNTILNFLAVVILGGGATQIPRVIRKNSTNPVVERLDAIETAVHSTEHKVNGLTERVDRIEANQQEGADNG